MQEKSEALLPVSIQTRNNLIAVILILIIAVVIAYSLASVIANPIVRLTMLPLNLLQGI